MASGTSDLLNFQNYGISITVQTYGPDFLNIAGAFPFMPEFGTTAAEVMCFARGKSGVPGFLVHPAQHENFAACSVLSNGRNQAAPRTFWGTGVLEVRLEVGPMKRRLKQMTYYTPSCVAEEQEDLFRIPHGRDAHE